MQDWEKDVANTITQCFEAHVREMEMLTVRLTALKDLLQERTQRRYVAVTCDVPQYGANFDIDAMKFMNVLVEDDFKDRPNKIDIMNEEGELCLVGIDCTTNG